MLFSSHVQSVDWDDAIKPVYHAFEGSDPYNALHPDILYLLDSITFDGILEYGNATNTTNTTSPEEKARNNAIWAYISTTYTAPLLYYKYGDDLVEGVYENCAVQCSYDVCP